MFIGTKWFTERSSSVSRAIYDISFLTVSVFKLLKNLRKEKKMLEHLTKIPFVKLGFGCNEYSRENHFGTNLPIKKNSIITIFFQRFSSNYLLLQLLLLLYFIIIAAQSHL